MTGLSMQGGIETKPLCVKCGATRARIWLQSGARCQKCFLSFMERAFKVSLGRSGFGGRRPGKIAIFVSGGPCSSSVAYMYATYLSTLTANPRAPSCRPVLVHVKQDPSGVVAVEALSQQLDMELHVLEIDSLVFKDSTDSVLLHKKRLLAAACEAAAKLCSDKVLVGVTADRAAVEVLSRLFAGCGSSVGDNAKELLQVGGLAVLRPLLHVPVRQVVRYSGFVLSEINFSNTNVGGVKMNMHKVLERFVGEAQNDNNACVHNVVRTAAKLSSSTNWYPVCVLCGETCERSVLSTKEAVVEEECEKYTCVGHNVHDAKMSCSCTADGFERSESSTSDQPRNSEHARPHNSDSVPLCYGCKGVFARAGGLQSDAGSALCERISREKRQKWMHMSIKEYFITSEKDSR